MGSVLCLEKSVRGEGGKVETKRDSSRCGSCSPCAPSGKEEEVCSGIARAAATIGRRACQSPGPEAEKRKEIRALAWKGGRRVEPA